MDNQNIPKNLETKIMLEAAYHPEAKKSGRKKVIFLSAGILIAIAIFVELVYINFIINL